jgi:hypothetical protein
MCDNGDPQGLSGPPGAEFDVIAKGIDGLKSAIRSIPVQTMDLMRKDDGVEVQERGERGSGPRRPVFLAKEERALVKERLERFMGKSIEN